MAIYGNININVLTYDVQQNSTRMCVPCLHRKNTYSSITRSAPQKMCIALLSLCAETAKRSYPGLRLARLK